MIISVIIPCYNQAEFLSKAVASLQAQTHEEWEAIIVDDGSTDNSFAIAKSLAMQDKRIRVYKQSNGGSGSARNNGLEHAKGEYIQFLDADDTIAPNKFADQVSAMEQQNADISYTDFSFFNSNGYIDKARSTRINYCKVLTRWGIGYSVPIHAFLYKRSLIGSTRFDADIRLREDWYWALNMLGRAKHFIHVPICGAYYYQNVNGKTGSVVRMQKGNFHFMEQMYPRMHGWEKIGWLYRISEEFWIYLLRRIKTRDSELKGVAPSASIHMFAAILMMPISLISVIDYTYKTYILEKHYKTQNKK